MRHRSHRDESISYLENGQLEPVQTRTALDDLIEAEKIAHDAHSEADSSLLAQCPPGVLLALLRFLVPAGQPTRLTARSVGYRVLMLSHAAGLDGIADRSFAELAKHMGVSRALLSLVAVNLADELGELKPRGGKRPESREVYRDRAKAYHERSGHIMKEVAL